MAKLTPPQVKALEWLSCHIEARPDRHNPYRAYEGLVKRGLAIKRPSGLRVYYKITEQGRAALKEASDE